MPWLDLTPGPGGRVVCEAEGRSRTCLCRRSSAFRLTPFRVPKEEIAEPLPAIDESGDCALSEAPLQRFTEGLDNLVEAEALHDVAQVLPIGPGDVTSRSLRSIGIPVPIERCCVVEYTRVAASSTGVPSASPIARGKTPQRSASHGMVVPIITLRANVQIAIPRKNVRRSPTASVSEPASKVKIVIAGAQTQPINAPAAWSLKPRSLESHKTIVLFVTE